MFKISDNTDKFLFIAIYFGVHFLSGHGVFPNVQHRLEYVHLHHQHHHPHKLFLGTVLYSQVTLVINVKPIFVCSLLFRHRVGVYQDLLNRENR